MEHFQPDLPITVEADASDFALGCILSQQNPDGELHPVCYYSRKFSPAELNYPIYDKELLAVVEAFMQWRVYVTMRKLNAEMGILEMEGRNVKE